ncbi:hypothetical protein CDAR_198751 [Caerostris darwini]|uniref:Uncharacterized protein n=1 Tax=Caerostris darwini TaxID=1538125 RepID=A0AAV4W4V3_9ARAC|nr:hypothetical protein CDAR_198751 [Caerostris darwini]
MRQIRTVAERSRQRHTPLFFRETSWAKTRFFSLYWASSIMQEPRQGDITMREHLCLASGERDVKGKREAPQASFGKRRALLTLRNFGPAKRKKEDLERKPNIKSGQNLPLERIQSCEREKFERQKGQQDRETHAIVLRRHFSGEGLFLLSLLGIIYYAGAASGDIRIALFLHLARDIGAKEASFGKSPSLIWEKGGLSGNVRRAERKRKDLGAHSMLGRGEQRAGWGAISGAQCVHVEERGGDLVNMPCIFV